MDPPRTCHSFLEVTLPDDTFTNPVTAVAVAISFLPWITGFVICAVGLRSPSGSRARQLMVLTLIIIITNEAALKRLFAQRRPVESCLKSNGMPSSHTALSVAWAAALSMSQLSSSDKMLVPMLLLVPWARVHVGDHSWAQVGAGASFGLIVAAAQKYLLGKDLRAILSR